MPLLSSVVLNAGIQPLSEGAFNSIFLFKFFTCKGQTLIRIRAVLHVIITCSRECIEPFLYHFIVCAKHRNSVRENKKTWQYLSSSRHTQQTAHWFLIIGKKQNKIKCYTLTMIIIKYIIPSILRRENWTKSLQQQSHNRQFTKSRL